MIKRIHVHLAAVGAGAYNLTFLFWLCNLLLVSGYSDAKHILARQFLKVKEPHGEHANPVVQNDNRYAFVQLAYDPPETHASASSMWQILPAARALQRVGSSFPLVVLTNIRKFADGTDVSQALKRLNAEVVPAHKVPIPEALENSFAEPSWKYAFQKLQIWDLTQFNKVIWMDSDSLLVRNIDWMFRKDGIWAQRDNWDCASSDASPSTEMCSGLMLVKPEKAIYEGLQKYAETLPSLIEGDQMLISMYFQSVLKQPIGLLDDLVAAFGHCVGALPSIPYSDPSGSTSPGLWGMPSFIHKSNELNKCFNRNTTKHLRSKTDGIQRNMCQYNPLSRYWRELLCEAVDIIGVKDEEVRVFCDDEVFFQEVN